MIISKLLFKFKFYLNEERYSRKVLEKNNDDGENLVIEFSYFKNIIIWLLLIE